MILRSIDLMLTRRCNLRCAFCYIEHRTSHNEPGEVQRNVRTCQWFVDQYQAGALGEKDPALRINLYGGEPMCAWDSVQALVQWARIVKQKTGITIYFGLVTNMSLMDEEKLDYCIANKISIHPSIDGCQEVEDMFRVTEDGETVSDAVYANARRMMTKLPHRSCRSTVCPATIPYMLKSLRFLMEDIGFKTVNQVLAGGCEWSDANIEGIREQTELITDWWLDAMRAGRHYDIYYLRNMFAGIWNPMRPRKLCSSGLSRACIDTDGTLTPCHRFANSSTDPRYIMGNIWQGGVTNTELETLLKNFDMPLAHKDKCARCPAVNSCRALCLHEMMASGRGMFEPCEHYCKVWPIYHAAAMRAHSIMVAEQNQLYLRTYRPQQRTGKRTP